MAIEPVQNPSPSLSDGPWPRIVKITPSDNELTFVPRGVYCGSAGNLVVTDVDDQEHTIPVEKGSHPFGFIKRIRATSTITGGIWAGR